MGKLKTLTCAEHQVLAARVKAARELLLEIHLTSSRLGVTSKASKVSRKILAQLDEVLKDELSRAAGQVCPPEIDAIDLYYGSTSKNTVVHHSRKPE